MNKEDKEKVFANFANKSEKERLLNKGEEVSFGNEKIKVKALPFFECDAFEDKIVKMFGQLDDLAKQEVFVKANKFRKNKNAQIDMEGLFKVIKGLLGNDLIDLANIATRGKVTKETIIETEATKADIINIIMEAFKHNYGHIKNLIRLIPRR
jgi:hypothetical protein